MAGSRASVRVGELVEPLRERRPGYPRGMHTRALGDAGLAVSAVGLGGMYLSIDGRPAESDAVRTIHAALDAGVTLVDTADVYCLDDGDIGHNERLIARALREKPGAGVVVATKGGLERPSGAWTRNARPSAPAPGLRAQPRRRSASSASTSTSSTRPTPSVPLADSVGELARLRAEGKIAHVGLSNVSVREIERGARASSRSSAFRTGGTRGTARPETDGVLAHCTKRGHRLPPVLALRRRERRALARERRTARGRGEAARRVAAPARPRVDAREEPRGHPHPGRAAGREHRRLCERSRREALGGRRGRGGRGVLELTLPSQPVEIKRTPLAFRRSTRPRRAGARRSCGSRGTACSRRPRARGRRPAPGNRLGRRAQSPAA